MTTKDVPPPLARAVIDRAAQERLDDGLLARARADEQTRVLLVHGDRAPLEGRDRLRWSAPADAPEGAEWAFLGRDAGDRAMLVAAVPASAAEPPVGDAEWGGLRAVGGDLDADDAGRFVQALSIGRWLIDAPFCPACGARTDVQQSGWSRVCPQCGRQHFPRTDPAVIVAVASADDQRLLLGRNAAWGDVPMYSTFAGFVEAGESLETTVDREIAEEAGVRLDHIVYRGSQAWPYPRSLMLGFTARAVSDEEARPDGEEILDVRWFTRDEIRAALDGAGDVRLPGRASIARSLITRWVQG
ncbi:NAD(+) diphosphatase [Microbacterium sp. EYE_5]|uniref:NAD(+) diphosphatase n=1 Tax=unclassified Microbacterium TaxID=2609290 RepID=UPI0020066F10|nr:MULTISPECIES: NAD(+) diphosphatase [unclassified Microbacterium]MCK6081018.1 NAD(+) diphosphatase [Microbacterium sp. EYE_382]MCK6086288.1 NAD(+) diphosphatase [Microbacterium sp. EYE_384]MCK6124214.1 NAD(+) diphosphatase [Microbacterium sp. EYE_80]MCK6127123.1 NAD(+) diphosphatase [Microbacterium sp. EYE_79]MCK6141973.1 NAD(+) diphosphatase [Microbacterium sp. EYE_39]